MQLEGPVLVHWQADVISTRSVPRAEGRGEMGKGTAVR